MSEDLLINKLVEAHIDDFSDAMDELLDDIVQQIEPTGGATEATIEEAVISMLMTYVDNVVEEYDEA